MFKIVDHGENCPNCNVSLLGEPIPQELIDKGYYGKQTHWFRVIGIEDPRLYDGVAYWRCPDCNHQWNRFEEVEYE